MPSIEYRLKHGNEEVSKFAKDINDKVVAYVEEYNRSHSYEVRAYQIIFSVLEPPKVNIWVIVKDREKFRDISKDMTLRIPNLIDLHPDYIHFNVHIKEI